MAEYIGMNKLKWFLLVAYGLYIILSRIPKLAILSKLPIKKDIYILSCILVLETILFSWYRQNIWQNKLDLLYMYLPIIS